MGQKNIPKYLQRARVRAAFQERGFETESRTGRGILPDARLRITRDGEAFEVAVKCSLERSLGFSRKSTRRWRTLDSVDLLAAIVPVAGGSGKFQIYCFEASSLIEAYNKALSGMREARRAPSLEMPIYIPLDRRSRKNVGHHESDLAKRAMWDIEVEVDQSEETIRPEHEDSIQRAKREFAERNQVSIDRVSLELKIIY